MKKLCQEEMALPDFLHTGSIVDVDHVYVAENIMSVLGLLSCGKCGKQEFFTPPLKQSHGCNSLL